MPIRDFDDGYWTDPYVQPLVKDAKLLYLYLWTNKHCNQAGLYEITLKSISFDTGIAEDELPDLFKLIPDKVTWYPEKNLVWVKNFVKRQAKSPQFLVAVAKCLMNIHHNGAVQSLIQYNYDTYTISIPYPYGSGSTLIPPLAATATVTVTATDPNRGGEDINKFLIRTKEAYEKNIGKWTEQISEELKALATTYSVEWVVEAIREAVLSEHRNLKYITAILKRWQRDGFKSPRIDRSSRRVK